MTDAPVPELHRSPRDPPAHAPFTVRRGGRQGGMGVSVGWAGGVVGEFNPG
jgi:hypothetical protein